MIYVRWASLIASAISTISLLYLAFEWAFGSGFGLHPGVVGALIGVLWLGNSAMWAVAEPVPECGLCDCCGQVRGF